LDNSQSLTARLTKAARDFDARTADWPVWRRLVVFLPVFLVIACLIVVAIIGATTGLRAL
jgi:uncharacterized protein (DUF983 family)